MYSEKIFFVHGGPGFNSVAEEAILKPHFEDMGREAFFWNEDHPTGFDSLTDQILTQFLNLNWNSVHLIAHSFGIFSILPLLRQHRDRISRLTLITPSTDLLGSYRRILNLAKSDFEKLTPPAIEHVRTLETALKENQTLVDAPMLRGFESAFLDDNLFNHYWVNKKAMGEFFTQWKIHQKGLDSTSFKAILLDLKDRDLVKLLSPLTQIENLPVTTVYGAHDPIVPFENQSLKIRGLFSVPVRELKFENSSHYPHLEEVENFLSCGIVN